MGTSGICLIRYSDGWEGYIGLEMLGFIENAHLCTEIMSDRDNPGLYRFHCISG